MKLRNNTAAFGWAVSVAFLLGCTLFSYILVRDGSSHIQIYPPQIPQSYPPWFMPLVLSVFWVAGIAIAMHVAKTPCTSVEVRPDKSVVVVQRFPFNTSVRHVEPSELSPLQVFESTDSEGDPDFEVHLTTPDGFTVCIVEGHDRQRCESVCLDFDEAIGRRAGMVSRE